MTDCTCKAATADAIEAAIEKWVTRCGPEDILALTIASRLNRLSDPYFATALGEGSLPREVRIEGKFK